ncbi:SDR family NAD(P)-dependent oxidoreductase [Herbivorax sp. ANBcel31]|uniref:SDR family NAD(P)-dependent oxidoreductase n=1 Tax=Herbivorax sp. ANBcel31 TaxID=3069754 RepID=UPI0027B0B0FF|nr:SDR family NAD(P)-dependent oxidoreductase [Herbivorax sp. ANBcel31]MDQ2086118.1 SDR family NAD(P)-dependent oxidoreductase [Herbivorax sp. ANBcel31]
MNKYYYSEERVAIVGMGGLFPDASNKDVFWENILNKKVSIKDVPNHIFNSKVFYRPEMYGQVNKQDMSYTKIGALIDTDKLNFLSNKYRIPPTVAEQMDPNQHTAIYCVDQALQCMKSSIPKERAAVIFGTGAPGTRYDNVTRRTYYYRVKNHLMNNSKLKSTFTSEEMEELIDCISEKSLEGILPVTEDSAPGMLQSINAGRISNVFDFLGPAYTVDAACASGLAASVCGVTGLLRRDFDVAFVGGIDVTMSEIPMSAFSAINALSPDGSFPFDKRANGFVIGLGGGVLILKRLEDALRDKDEIFGVISGFGQGSDGKGKGVAAPNKGGQIRVVENSCKMAGYPVDTIELVEAHGTGTPVGDQVEVEALKEAFLNLGAERKNYCGIGSVKSNIGHLRYASGAPGMIKGCMALYNKILPPTANVQEVNPKLRIEDSPFYILNESKKWEQKSWHPRRANVSAYGFGGADFHICMEEFRPEFVKKSYAFQVKSDDNTSSIHQNEPRKLSEVVLFSGNTVESIKDCYFKFIDIIKQGNKSIEETVLINNSSNCAKDKYRLAIVFDFLEELKDKWSYFEKCMENKEFYSMSKRGIYFKEGKIISSDEMAWMFPGQASQYPNMLKQLYENYTCVESLYTQADALWRGKYDYDITSFIFREDEEVLEEVLKDTKNTHPTMFLSNIGMYKLLIESGIRADYMIGHSLGEITALFASGMLNLREALNLVGERGFSFDAIPEKDRGILMGVKEDRSKLESIIENEGFNVSISNINSPEQTVIGGQAEEIEKASKYLKGMNIYNKVLNVSHGFHTALMNEAAESFYNKIKDFDFYSPKEKVMSCHLNKFYPDRRGELKDIPDILKEQIISKVNFKDAILSLYDKGVRVFIESGPSTVLTNLVKNILRDKDVIVLSSNKRGESDVKTYKKLLGQLFTLGVDVTHVPSRENLKSNCCNDSIKVDNEIKTIKKTSVLKENIVYSGVSVGLPGTFKKAFSNDNFNHIFEGRNFIEKLTDDEMESLLDLNITRLVKNEQKVVFKKLSLINEVIQIAGKFGEFDMLNDYQIDEKTLSQMTLDVCAGVAAGYEALKDAKIPLMREKIFTSSGSSLEGRLVLPKEMQRDTGIIYACGFPAFEPFICEVSKYIASKFGSKTRRDLIDFYQEVISKIKDDGTRKILSDWFNFHYSKLLNNSGEEDIYEFNHEFLIQISSLANNRLAQFIGAMGPNFHIRAACSSTASAVTVAEDLIRGGHAKRMIVVGADNASSKKLLPWIGGSFLSMGAASDSDDVFESSVPFDNRRNGMIIGAGAVGLVMEKEEDVGKRGMNGICRILGTHMFNAAGHQVKIESKKYCDELDRFISKMEKEHGFNRIENAKETVYFSHETCSPKKGGCAEAEKMVLEKVFKEKYGEIKIVNTKAMTGHTMGASLEEAVAAKALLKQEIPPVANFKNVDPSLEGLNISSGGRHNFKYALRMVIGYGGQGNFHLLEKISSEDARIFDSGIYDNWLREVSGFKNARLKNQGRILVAEGDANEEISKNSSQKTDFDESVKKDDKLNRESEKEQPSKVKSESSYLSDVLGIISEVTKYPTEMLEKDMEMEADLGIDTVKQATIFSLIGEKYGMSDEENINMSSYKTIGDVIDFVKDMQKDSGLHMEEKVKEKKTEIKQEAKSKHGAEEEVLKIVSEVTKYPVEMLEKDMEMEADLGIDTVKQATIFSMIAKDFKMDEDEDLNISEYKTIGDVIDFVKNKSDVSEVKGRDIDSNKNIESVKEEKDYEIERDLSLQVPVFVEENLGSKDFDLKEKRIWVIGDEEEVVGEISNYFKEQSKLVEEFTFDRYKGSKELEDGILKFMKDSVDVIVDCSHIGKSFDIDNISTDKEEVLNFLNGEARFLFYKKLGEKVSQPEIRIVCAVSMDGCHGYLKGGCENLDPFFGALSGFYKGLRKEWSNSKVKIIDVGAVEREGGFQEIASKLKTEIECSSFDYEIGYKDNKRMVLRIDYLDKVELQKVNYPENIHFLISGGGNGITSEIIRKLSKKYRGKFTIIGRTKLEDNIESLSLLSDEQLEDKKIEIKEQLQKEHSKVTPVMVKDKLEKIKKAISVYKLVNEIKSDGNEAVYISCDVRNHEQLEKNIKKSIKKNGSVHILIHGAGIERSKLLKDKRVEEFKDVFSVKVKGFLNLYRLLEKKELKAIIGFSSISGRFGNEAQLDYCAANSFINGFISSFKSKYQNIHGLSIAWSGWKDLGIAWRNEYLKENFEEIGLNLIEPERGALEFVNLLEGKTSSNEVIVSKGLEFIMPEKIAYENPPKTLFIDWISKRNGLIEKAFKVFSVKKDPIINQHRLGETPLMPAVAFMEMFAQYHSLVFGRKDQYCFKNLILYKPCKLFYERPQEIILDAKRGEEKEGFKGEIYTYLDSKYGISKLINLNSMEISSSISDYSDLLNIRGIENEPMEEGFTRANLENYHEKNPNSIVLGPLFIDEEIENNKCMRNSKGAMFSMTLPEEEINNEKYNLEELLINPAFMDSIFQVCGVHTAYNNDRVFLPWKVEEVGVVQVPREYCGYKVYSRLKEEGDEYKKYDVIMLNQYDEVCYYAKNVVMRQISL